MRGVIGYGDDPKRRASVARKAVARGGRESSGVGAIPAHDRRSGVMAMLQVTLDIFSGRANPSAYLDGEEALDLLRVICLNRGVLAAPDSGYQGLGFRGVLIEPTEDTVCSRYGLPAIARIAAGATDHEAKAQEIAERLIVRVLSGSAADGIAFPPRFESSVLDMMTHLPTADPDTVEDEAGTAPASAAVPAVTCQIELGAFNPGFWNDPAHINKNNCYNYASNKRTDTFAQPGRGSGHQYTALTCAAVTAAALSDRLHHRFDCFPDTEKPRWLAAMVVAPGIDYHWYRKQKEGFWGHKPGHTAARNTDNNGAVVSNPETCARYPYTDFCGYFYVPRSQTIN
jgi:hypothetical protein